MKPNPQQKAALLRGRLAEAIRCGADNLDDRADAHRRLDLVLDEIARLEGMAKDKPIATFKMPVK